MNIVPIGRDESFSSWVYRVSLESPDFIEYDSVAAAYDPDMAFASCSELELEAREGGAAFIDIFNIPSWGLLPWPSRRAYCSLCLRHDIAIGGMPYWRKMWGMLYVPLCPIHKNSLSIFHTPRVTLSKAWSAFQAECELRNQGANTTNWCVSGGDSCREVVLKLALRVQGFICDKFYHPNDIMRVENESMECRWLQKFIIFLFCNFLYPRTRGAGPDGIARQHQTSLPRKFFKTVAEARAHALAEPDPYARIVSLVLIGRILNVIKESELETVRDYMGVALMTRASVYADIPYYGIVLRNRHEVKAWNDLAASCPGIYCTQIQILASYIKR